jgi:hypothetical protein
MSTSPVGTPVPASNVNVQAWVPVPTLSWLQKHEKIVIVLLVVLLGVWGFQKYADQRAVAAETKAAVAESVKAAADRAAAQNAVTVQQVTQQYQTIIQTQTAQIQALMQQQAARDAAAIAQQKTDATLPSKALAQRMAAQANIAPVDITVLGDDIRLTRPGALAVVQTMEQIPVLQANLKDETAVAKSTQTELDQANSVIGVQKTQITDLNNKNVADSKACQAEIAVVKAKARKDALKWFARGGAVVGTAIEILLHLK